MSELDNQMRNVWWELAIAWKLYDTAVRERRFDDANYYSKQREAAEIKARELLRLKESKLNVTIDLTLRG